MGFCHPSMKIWSEMEFFQYLSHTILRAFAADKSNALLSSQHPLPFIPPVGDLCFTIHHLKFRGHPFPRQRRIIPQPRATPWVCVRRMIAHQRCAIPLRTEPPQSISRPYRPLIHDRCEPSPMGWAEEHWPVGPEEIDPRQRCNIPQLRATPWEYWPVGPLTGPFVHPNNPSSSFLPLLISSSSLARRVRIFFGESCSTVSWTISL